MSTQAIKTAPGIDFRNAGDVSERRSLFTVTAGVPLLDALQSVSDLLSTIQDPIVGAGMGEALVGNTAWLVNHTLESAKAVVESLVEAIEDVQRATE